jgi:hypothetical protein
MTIQIYAINSTKDDKRYFDNQTITTKRIRMFLTEYGLVTKVSISRCLGESKKLFQDRVLCTSGIFSQKFRETEKHAYLNMI